MKRLGGDGRFGRRREAAQAVAFEADADDKAGNDDWDDEAEPRTRKTVVGDGESSWDELPFDEGKNTDSCPITIAKCAGTFANDAWTLARSSIGRGLGGRRGRRGEKRVRFLASRLASAGFDVFLRLWSVASVGNFGVGGRFGGLLSVGEFSRRVPLRRVGAEFGWRTASSDATDFAGLGCARNEDCASCNGVEKGEFCVFSVRRSGRNAETLLQ